MRKKVHLGKKIKINTRLEKQHCEDIEKETIYRGVPKCLKGADLKSARAGDELAAWVGIPPPLPKVFCDASG